ncbi:MAG: hypothetical protein C0417_09110 [Chlorobiaceae bacterium]|nr:hypothetical protein [Chlorobiaceae bacterium]
MSSGLHKYIALLPAKFFYFKYLLFLTLLPIFQIFSQTPVSLYNNISGRVNYTVIGGTLRQQANPNSCTVKRSSTSRLTVPPGGIVSAAYLYWAGSYQSSPDYRVRLNNTVINATRTFTVSFNNSGTLLPFFSGFADVTSFVISVGNGNYTFDSLTVNTGSPHCDVQAVVAGWAMVVVYQRAAEIKRSINIYDGFDYFRGSTITFNPGNFYVPSNQVEGRLTHITWEGDVENSASLNGFAENLYFNGSVLTDATNPINNQFNSASSELGLTNTYGVDIDSYTLNSYLSPGDTSAVSSYSSGGDLVLLNCEVISVSDTSTADVSILKTHSGGASLTAGSITTFTLSVTNNGPDTTGTITVIDSLPVGASLISINAPGWSIDSSAKPKYIFQHVGNHPPGVSISNINITVSLNHENYPKLYNTAHIYSSLFDRRPWNNTSTDSINILSPLFDQSTKSLNDLNGNNINPGDTLSYTIKIKNTGNYSAPNVNVVDTLPSGVIIVPGSLSPAGTINGNIITFNPIATIANNDSTSVIYRVIVDSSIIGGMQAINRAHIRSLTIDMFVTASFTPQNIPDMILLKISEGSRFKPNDTITYRINYANNSSTTLSTGTEIIDTLPTNTSYIAGSASAAGTWDPAPAPKGRIVWNLGNIPGLTQNDLSYKVVIDNSVPPGTILTNTVHLFNLQGSSLFATIYDTTYTGATASLSANPIAIAAGDSVTFTLTDADLNILASTIESYTFLTISSKGEIENLIYTETNVNSGVFISGIGTVFGAARGIDNDYLYSLSPGDTIFATYLDTLTASGDSSRIQASVEIVAVDFSTSSKSYIDLNGGIAIPTDTISYTIVVRNTAVVLAKTVTVTDTIPPSLSVVPGSITGGGILSGNLISFAPFSLGPNDSITFTFSAIIDTTVIDNSAILNSASINGGGASEIVSASFTVSNKPVITMIKNVSAPIVSIGDTVEYLITFTNIGTGIATNVVLTDTIPQYTVYIPQSVILNGFAKTDQSDGDEAECDGIIIHVALQHNLRPGAGGVLKYRVRIQ